ncbi:nuclear transport factor 2 family protein [Marivirga tractuosa]|uniref:YybH family protein n=1 Tax=Marivirga tractuosa TaxID=1006 RepID=UPI0035CF04BE
MKLYFIFSIVLSSVYYSSYAQSNSTVTHNLIEDRLQLMAEEFNQGNLNEVADFYTSDAAVIGPKTSVKGEEIKSYWPKFGGVDNWKLESLSVEVLSADVVNQIGISRMYYKNAEGKNMTSASKFTLIWVKVNGEWRIKQDFFFPISD